ncbi:MAG: response regulator [Alphaproteobacteria bacterium]|nr:response regulator [Alphaproteobacteria bacterium]NCQ88543.1 response regulator [Alphaproteobacteria bacterium]NCT06086.1 response regulator [Alphaproteobacteria bacterium]
MGFQFEKLSVLVVEDTVPMRKLLVTVLENLGIRNIDVASDGEKAFEIFQKENHDIILTDWVMNNMDGLDLTRAVRNNTNSPNRMAPIILITGYSAWSRVEKARDDGVTEFLVKPFTANDIAKRIAHVIAKPRNFIETQEFFGPDRRRRVDPTYAGPFRREDDNNGYSSGRD